MKKSYTILFIISLFFSTVIQAQCNTPTTITFTDSNLEANLIQFGYDTDQSGTIEDCELYHKNIVIDATVPMTITSLQGMENAIVNRLEIRDLVFPNNEVDISHLPKFTDMTGPFQQPNLGTQLIFTRCTFDTFIDSVGNTQAPVEALRIDSSPNFLNTPLNPNLDLSVFYQSDVLSMYFSGMDIGLIDFGSNNWLGGNKIIEVDSMLTFGFSNMAVLGVGVELVISNHLLQPQLPLFISHPEVGILVLDNLDSSFNRDLIVNGFFTSLTVQNSDIDLIDLNNHKVPSATNLTVLNNPNLKHIFLKNGEPDTIVSSNNPNLKYVCADELEITTLFNQLPTTVAVNTYCSFQPVGASNQIMGDVNFDTGSNNCTSGAIPMSLPIARLDIDDGFDVNSILLNTSYSRFLPDGNYTLQPVIVNSSGFSINPASVAANLIGSSTPFIQDFCVSKTSVNPDIDIQIIPLTPPSLNRPGFNSKYKVIVRNVGTEIHTVNFSFEYDDRLMDFVSATGMNAHNIVANTGTIAWNNIVVLNPFESTEEDVEFILNSPTHPTFPLSQNDIIVFNANLDDSSSHNIDVFTTTTINLLNSYDPNDKTCLQGDTAEPTIIGEYVDYVIRFENLGNADAINVVVKDVIDTSQFDISTLQVVSSNYSMRTDITNANEVEFIFENINLPPSPSAPAQPIIGYVAFKIKTLGTLSIGDTFNNQANIFFDFNLPVNTNDFETIITQVLSTGEKELLKAELFPNPAVNYIQLKTKEAIDRVLIYDINGRLVQTALHPDKEFDVSRLNKGVYMLQIFSGDKQISKKLIKL